MAAADDLVDPVPANLAADPAGMQRIEHIDIGLEEQLQPRQGPVPGG
jgi:hypothetical protein